MHLEANAFAPVSTEADFRASCYLEGQAILDEVAKPAPITPAGISGFVDEMNTGADWKPVPILVTGVEPGGPADHAFFERTLASMAKLLRAAGPIDAVNLSNHGAMTTTEGSDPDGAYYAMARQIAGPDAPVVSTIDLHANLSDRLVEATDAIIAYRINPHVDQRERAAEVARIIRKLLGGERLEKCFIRLPIVSPSVRLLTADGPYADLITYGQTQISPDLPIVSVVDGFAWSDTPENGLAILTYGQTAETAHAVAEDIAQRAWTDRTRYHASLTPLDEAVAMAKAAGADPNLRPLCIADVADNPGGGERGNTTDLLKSLLATNVDRALLGLFVDAAAAEACYNAGVSTEISPTLNEGSTKTDSAECAVKAKALAVSDGLVVGRRGIVAGRTINLGKAAVIQVAGLAVVLASRRIQAADPAFFEAFGLEPGSFQAVILKSRGHFRAGFDIFFESDQIIEADARGLTSPILERFNFKQLPRPVYPLDPDTKWQ